MAIEKEKTTEAAFWCEQIATYESTFQKWEKRSKQINDRYKDERDKNKGAARFNILWSNVQTLAPAIYDAPPKPNIERRRKDHDNAGRAVSQVLEKSVSYFVDDLRFDEVMREIVLDRLLSGRGTAWVRYVPDIQGDDLYNEDVVLEYVHWSDFGHTPARIWNEVRAVWRRVYLSRKELRAQLEKIGTALTDDEIAEIPADAKLTDDDKVPADKICVYEIWDRATKKVYWLNKSCPDLLGSQDDPLRLMEFFPCPRPLYSSNSTDNLIPLPDYFMYQDQAVELDELTGRIQMLTKALKIVGVYDKSAEGIQRILETGVENTLIPVSNWAVLGEKGGLKGVVDYFPVQDVMTVLASLFQAREAVKQNLYEISGISDIVRGATKASETATAQKIKGQFATLRIDSMQAAAARFSRDIVAIMTEIIAEHFSLDTIKKISGVPLLTEQEKAQAVMVAQQGQPLPQNVQRMMRDPTWEQVERIIRDDTARCFSIKVETDSTIKIDQEADKKMRSEFLGAVSNFLQQAVQVEDPKMKPLLGQMLLFGTKGFKIGRDLETAFINYIDDADEQAAMPPAPPAPDPSLEVSKMQMAQQSEANQAQMQIKGAELQLKEKEAMTQAQIEQAQIEIKQQELGLKAQELRLKEQEIALKAQLEREAMSLDLKKTIITKMQTEKPESGEGIEEEDDAKEKALMVMVEQIAAAVQGGLQTQAESNMAVAQSIQNPPPRKIIRDNSGNIIGLE